MTTATESENYTNVLVRMPVELKDALQREATATARKLTAEINVRLQQSLEAKSTPGIGATAKPAVKKNAQSAEVAGAVNAQHTEAAMLELFRTLPPEKQLALLTLFK